MAFTKLKDITMKNSKQNATNTKIYFSAGINIDAEDINKEIKLIKDLGYIGIKIT